MGGDGDDGEELAGADVKHGDAARADVGGVGAGVVRGDGEHVRFGRAGGDGGEDLERGGIDDGDGVFDLGSDIEQAVLGTDEGAVRAEAAAEIDFGDKAAGGNVDDGDGAPVGAGAADAGVAEDGDEGAAAIGRGDDFMAGNAVDIHSGEGAAGGGVHDAEAVAALDGDEEETAGGGLSEGGEAEAGGEEEGGVRGHGGLMVAVGRSGSQGGGGVVPG